MIPLLSPTAALVPPAAVSRSIPADDALAPGDLPESPELRRADPARVREPAVQPTWPWLAMQLVPSPGLAIGAEGAALDLRWQVTPVLYSFGIDPRLSPWRFFVAEPIVRQSGSLELHASPEYLAVRDELGQRFGFRVGTRATFPLLHRGDYLSVSVGSSYYRFAFHEGASFELGGYVLFGMLGLQVQLSPGFAEAPVITNLSIRFF
jgi:hypothetical protein